MEGDIHKLFKNTTIYPKGDLAGNIWHSVITRETRRNKIRSLSYGFAGILSFLWLIFALRDLAIQFSQSGFSEYLSLAFSDWGAVTGNIKEFALSLADSLPISSLIFSLVALFLLFISIEKITRRVRSPLSLV